MSLIVQKFGGTSLADPKSRESLVNKAHAARARGEQIVLVVSAMGRRGDAYATDTLLEMLSAFPGGEDKLTRDLMASCGEVISACVISALLNSKGIAAVPMTAASAGIIAAGEFGDAALLPIDPVKIRAVLDQGEVPVITGFQGIDGDGRILTLGRGGSDTSAVALGIALKAEFVDIYKDVPGVAKADPRIIPEAPFMEFLDYDSMYRLANHGARVLHDKSADLARTKGMRLRVRSTFGEGEGTLIGPSGDRIPPTFIGLSTSPLPGNRIKVAAVFASGRGKEGVMRARGFAQEWAATRGPVEFLEETDPDAAVFSLPAEPTSASGAYSFARALFPLL
jgi:aspartate kinase